MKTTMIAHVGLLIGILIAQTDVACQAKSSTTNSKTLHGRNIETEPLPDTISAAVAIIKTPRGTGTGFLYKDKDETYLLTNEHITRGGFPISAILLDGNKLELKSFEVADNLDLVRFKVSNTNLIALEVSETGFAIDKDIKVMGNSGGEGVATLLKGKILGLGPDRIEVSAPFIQGNSGSPIVSTDGRVLAVATYVVRPDDPGDWVQRGTRFNQARRFGLRPCAAKWVAISQVDYVAISSVIKDLSVFCDDYYDLTIAKIKGPEELQQLQDYSFVENVTKYKVWTNLCKLMANVNAAMKKTAKAELKLKELVNIAKKYEQRVDYSDVSFFSEYHAVKKARSDADECLKTLQASSVKWINSTKWITTNFSEEATYWREIITKLTEIERKNEAL